MLRSRFRIGEDYAGMKESAGNSGGDGDEIALSAKNFNLRGARHFGQIDGPAAADEGGVFFRGSYARELRRQFAGVDAQRLHSSLLRRSL